MDKTTTYIKMSDCEEIQPKEAQGWVGGSHQGGNIYFYTQSRHTQKLGIPGGYYYLMEEYYEDDEGEQQRRNIKTIWLPTQDRLQEMVFPDKSTSVRQMLDKFYPFVRNTKLICTSMEQLWLAFYMFSKHNKTWDGEKWV